jgi:transcriptional regulator GlxA family with amidase domain
MVIAARSLGMPFRLRSGDLAWKWLIRQPPIDSSHDHYLGGGMPRDPATIAVLMFDGAPLFETSVPLSVFGVDRSESGAPAFTVLPVGAEGPRLRSTGGVELRPPYGLDDLARAGVVIVPSWRDPLEVPPVRIIDAIGSAHDDGAVLVSLCLGAFAVAPTGLLDGRRAATHWFHAPTLARRYPRITVDPSVLYIDEGDVLTSAGTSAGLDACLHLVRRTWGARAASAIARRMVVAPHRPGGQAQYVDRPVPDLPDGDDLAEAIAGVLADLTAPADVDALARHAHMSRRTFDRRFREITGTSPLQWLLHQRVLHAQRLLEDSDLTVDAVARAVGLANAVSLRPHFRRLVGTSPQRYRETFRTTVAS